MNAQRAHKARIDAETRCSMAERERDIYRLLARRWQSRLNAVLNRRGEEPGLEGEAVEDATSGAMFLNGREQVAIFGLGGMFRHMRTHAGAGADSDDGEDDDGNIEDVIERNGIMRMEEDDEDSDEMVDDQEEEDDTIASRNEHNRPEEVVDVLGLSVSPATAKAIASRPQIRSVSIEGER